MNRARLAALAFISLVAILVASPLQAGLWSDVKTLVSQRAELRSHSKSVTSTVRELWRERKAISEFNSAALALVRTYHDLKNGGKVAINKLIPVARNIVSLINGYQKLAPKFEAAYSKIAPDLDYFSKLREGDEPLAAENPAEFKFNSISDTRIKMLGSTGGWSKVWDAVKDDPVNLVRWGKLRDEYKVGKTETAYALKCAQIAYEGFQCYKTARSSLASLFAIKTEIDGILGGDISAILGAGNTVNSIMGAGSSIEKLGNMASKVPDHFNKRFEELGKYQNDYVEAYRNYQQKHGTPQAQAAATAPVASSGSANPSVTPTTQPNTGSWTSLQDANEAYAKAYRAYLALSQSSDASPEALAQAATQLRAAQQRLQQIKAMQPR